MRRIIVVGGGQAGAYAARTLRDVGFDGEVILLGEEAYAPYERPPLSKHFLQDAEMSSTLDIFPFSFWSEQGIQLDLCTRVSRVALGEGVITDDRLIPADGVILCPGARARSLNIPGVDLPGVHVLRTVADALALRAELIPGSRVVIVGGGLIGSELASTATAMGLSATVIDVEAVPLSRALGEPVGQRLLHEAAERGVVCRQGAAERIIGTDVAVGVALQDGCTIEADLVIVGVGAEPRTEVAVASGLDVSNGILCDADGRTSNPHIAVAGDAARIQVGSGRRRTEHWKSAIEQGGRAARSLLGMHNPPLDPVWFWTEQNGHRIEAVGDLAAPHIVVRGDPLGPDFSAWYLGATGELVGAVGFNRSRDVRVAARFLSAGGTVMNQSILQNEASTLVEAVTS